MKHLHEFLKVLLVISLLSLLVAGCGAGAQTPTPTSNPVLTTDMNIVSASAKLVPLRWASLSFSLGGQDVEILVQPGEVVKQDQVLARVDQAALKTALEQARLNLQRAELAYRQLKDLPSEEAVAAAKAVLASAEASYDQLDRTNARQINLDAAQAQVDSARLSLEAVESGASDLQLESAQLEIDAINLAISQAQSTLDDSEIKMPFDGQVVEVYYHNGEYAGPAQPAILVADLSAMQVETTDLSEVDAARVSVGDLVNVTFDALPDTTISGTVGRIADKASAGSAINFTVIIELSEIPQNIRWGMTAFAEIKVK
jgi:multidrug efflux pump subunit AcrA (membrane-fusion protein)